MNADSRSNAPRALITGLEGFTGYYLAEELRRAGFRVFGTSHRDVDLDVGIYKADLCDRDSLRRVVADVRPDVVAHLAAIAFVAHGDVDAIYRTNIMGTRNLLAVLDEQTHKPSSVLLASSANVYGNACIDIIDEFVSPQPANDYAVSKLAMEHMALLWMDKLPLTIVRPFNYTGVGQSSQFLLPKIVSHFQRGERVIELGNTEVERDFSDVRRVVNAYRRLLQMSPVGGIFNVCAGHTFSLKSIISMMQEIAGYQIDVRVNSAFVRANEVHRLQGSFNNLEAAIGPLLDIPLKETLHWMFSQKAI